ncbi:MAG: sugar phosphate isomerase/epimerase [Oscillospiraceae bacterium]|nr:sugar phosphate isomerase/epimerase [Oscillospiraceae bacterium]
MAKIGSPLFIVREDCGRDLMEILGRLSEIGYNGIEFLGFFGNKPSDIRKRLGSCGLTAVGDHVPFDEFAANTRKVIDEHKEIGCGYITVGAPKADGLPGGENYARTIETYEKLGEAVNSAGMKLLFHNHAEELRNTSNGKMVLENILDDVRADLLYFEPDLGWIQIGGADPVYYMQKYNSRCPVVHFKDYMPIAADEKGFVFRPTGYGVMNNAVLYAMSLSFNPVPEWYIMDHDCAYERDAYDDLALSLDYFKNLMMVTK